jgi:hypothetical protein
MIIKQIPVIEHQIKEIGENVRLRISELNIENQVATEDTVKFLKEIRAELNKEYSNYENDRKELKKAYMSPYDEFDILYKTEIANEYTKADELLKNKVASVELRIKEDKKNEVEIYFKELCIADNIEFVTFDKIGLKIGLSETLKKLKEQTNEYVLKVKDDLTLINSLPEAVEILVEYKKTLNASKAITEIQERHKQLKIEKERKHLEKCRQRQSLLRSNFFVYRDVTQTFEYNDDIFITKQEVEELDDVEYLAKYNDCLNRIEALKTPIQVVEAPKVVSVPVVNESEPAVKLVTSSFEVTGTLQQLKQLAEYMKSNNINFKSI